MVTIRFQYEQGQWIPLDPLPEAQDGDIIELEWHGKEGTTPLPTDAEIDAMLDRTRGMWADIADEIEEHIKEARQIWDEEWQNKLSSL